MNILKFIAIIFLYISSAYAQEKIYYVGVEDYIDHPFQSINENGEFYGGLRDILDSFAKKEGIKFEYKPYKSDELYKEFLSGNLDFKFPDNHIWKALEKQNYKIFYSEIVTHYIDGIFVKKTDLNKKIGDIKILGTNKGEDLIQILSKKEREGKIKIENAKTCAELISKLVDGEIEAIFCNYDVMRYLLKNSLFDKEIVINTDLPLIDNYFYLSSIKHKAIIEKFNIWVKESREYIERASHEGI